MDTISAVLITKNEASRILKCLDSLSFADEIVVLDTGSTDATIDICQKHGCKVFSSSWEGFGKAKAKAVSYASNDWILSIDADEVLSEALKKEIIRLRKDGFGQRCYRIKRRSFYLGKMIRFCGWQNDAPLRIFDRRLGSFNDAPVHERVINSAPRHTLKHYMLHYTYPDIESHYGKMRFYAELAANKAIASDKSIAPLSAEIRAGLKFLKMYFVKLGFLDGYTGLRLCLNSAWGQWYKYHLIWTRNR